ncbi:MAG: phosphoenolpyruvate kinase [Byssovorax sp.]
MIKTSLPADAIARVMAPLAGALGDHAASRPGAPAGRQPVHTFYGGAHLFRADLVPKIGKAALHAFEENAPDPIAFASTFGLPGASTLTRPKSPLAAFNVAFDDELPLDPHLNRPAWLAHTVYARVLEKLRHEPVEDLRIDFEDGYGVRTDAEEDYHAATAARELAQGKASHLLPALLGIRIKPLDGQHRARAVRTLDVFFTTLLEEAKTPPPPGFVVTLPKITVPEQVTALAELLSAIEGAHGLTRGSIGVELMIETPESLFGPRGELAMVDLVDRAGGRAVAAHLGAYDLTAACEITAAHQRLTHPLCDLARHLMQLALAQRGLRLADGATSTLPLPLHKPQAQPLNAHQISENREAIHRAWKLHYDNIQHALGQGFYQGWDLHPAQLPVRYAATYAFFLENLAPAAERLKNFVERAAQATRVGQIFDDAATGQGLLNFFLRALSSGALFEDEVLGATGLSTNELRGRSFVKIVESRRG